ncbi:MAG: AAA family ATPase [Anaerolineae bacterium]|nr:AAA family ATPase [Anaerolineae bacterium]
MQFSRIRLENWRNFSEVDVPLQTRAFLVGANASGKSNFLDVFRFLRDLVLPGGGFEKAVLSRGGVSSIRNLAARTRTDIAIDVELSEAENRVWRYRIVFNQDNNRRPILREEKVWDSNENLILNRPISEDDRDPARLGQTQLEQIFVNRDFREVATFFESVNYLHIVPQLIRDPERSIGHQNDPYGGDFLEQIARVNKRSRQARLKRIQETLKVVIPQLSVLDWDRDENGIPHLKGKYEHWRPQGAWQQENDFSDGTLRLIGLLWALQVGEGPLLLEEPELSLHPGVIRYLPQLMYRVQRARRKAPRQVFVSTHSPELLLDEGIGAQEIYLMVPTKEGTRVIQAASQSDIIQELEAGLTMADVVMPRTEPQDLYQMTLWE